MWLLKPSMSFKDVDVSLKRNYYIYYIYYIIIIIRVIYTVYGRNTVCGGERDVRPAFPLPLNMFWYETPQNSPKILII